MTELSQLGVLYVFIMLVILAIGFGLLAIKGMDAVIAWARKQPDSKEANGKASAARPGQAKPNQALWLKLAYVSVMVLFLSIFSLGILKTLGVSEDHESHHSGSSQTTTTQTSNVQMPNSSSGEMQQQLNYLNWQLYQIEASMNQSSNYRY